MEKLSSRDQTCIGNRTVRIWDLSFIERVS